MKSCCFSILLLISVIFNNSLYSQSGWFWQNPLPQGNRYRCVQYVNNNVIFAAGDYGTIVHTSNGGLTWDYKIISDISTKYIKFFDSQTGIAIGNNKIFKTTNQGIDWFMLGQYQFNFECIHFLNIYTGYSCIIDWDSSYFQKTTNGGLNWFLVNGNMSGIHSNMYFFDANTGIIIGGPEPQSGYIIRTSNGGLNWSVVMSAGGLLDTYSMLNSNTGVVGGVSGIYRTTNKGISWNTIYSSFCSCNSIAYSDSNTLYTSFFVPNPSLYRSTNGGYNWTTLYQGMQYYLNSICFLNSTNGIGVGYWGSIQRTTNGGLNWFDNGPFCNLMSIDFANVNTGCAVGDQGTMFRTTNGGDTWNYIALSSQYNLTDLEFITSATGILIGNDGTNGIILRTSNYGQNWNIISGISVPSLSSIFFIDGIVGFAVGDNGAIIKTTNSGSNWSQLDGGVSDKLNSVFFTDINTGFIGKNSNGLLKTTNQGQNWFIVPLAGYSKAVNFINSSTGFVGSTTSHIFKTTNGGNNWNINYLGSTYDVTCVTFTDMTTGYLITSGPGEIFKSTNCGLNWIKQVINTEEPLYCITFTNNLSGYVIGRGSSILKTTTGGEPIGIHPISYEIPESYHLSQNYPNPFNPKTIINFQLPMFSNVKLIIYDVLGKEVATLVNESFKPGSYEVEWDATNYPSGVYFYKLITGKFSESKKMVLVK